MCGAVSQCLCLMSDLTSDISNSSQHDLGWLLCVETQHWTLFSLTRSSNHLHITISNLTFQLHHTALGEYQGRCGADDEMELIVVISDTKVCGYIKELSLTARPVRTIYRWKSWRLKAAAWLGSDLQKWWDQISYGSSSHKEDGMISDEIK